MPKDSYTLDGESEHPWDAEQGRLGLRWAGVDGGRGSQEAAQAYVRLLLPAQKAHRGYGQTQVRPASVTPLHLNPVLS